MTSPAAEPVKRVNFLGAIESLIDATNAFKNVRAILLLGLTFVGAALVGAMFSMLGSSSGSAALIGLGGLLAFVVIFYGTNAVGVLLMREAQGQPVKSIMDAVLVSLFTSHRLIAVVALEFLIFLVVLLVITIVLFVCKIPMLGPFLYTFVFPITALLLGVLVFSLFYVMLPLAGPAVWSGSTVFQVIARLNMIAHTKLVSVILLEVLLFFIAAFTATLIFMVVITGVLMTSGLSANILDMGATGMGGFGNIMAAMSGSGYALAGGIGGGLLLAIAAVIPGLIFTKGICIIYLDATRNVDFAQAEASINQGLASVKRKADEARERARALTEQHAPAVPAMAAIAPLACPNCQAPISADDLFCGNCAHKLK